MEDILKRCSHCYGFKSRSDFNKDSYRSDGLAIYCRDCQRGLKREWRKRGVVPERVHREVRVVKVCRGCGEPLGNRGNHYDYCFSCLPSNRCIINYCLVCGVVISSPAVYCKVCYREKERLRGKGERPVRKSELAEYKSLLRSKGCVVCGYKTCDAALEFHHISQRKGKAISEINTVSRMKKEISNNPVVVLCANCHRELHNGLIDEKSLTPRRLINIYEQKNIWAA